MSSHLRKWILLQKKRGETPLEVLLAWKIVHPEYADVPMSYAGRLDPMAEGKLLVLIGDECKRQDVYTKLDKEYEIEILLNFKTDTGDVLGFPEYHEIITHSSLTVAIARELGSHSRHYPRFSSKTVKGKPLFLYTLEGTLDSITIPEHIETIYRIEQLGSYTLTWTELRTQVAELLSLVPRSLEPSKALGVDFRQDEIRSHWEELLARIPEGSFEVIKLRVTCASGVYMRTLAERIGISLGTYGLALRINRTTIGKYNRIGFWLKKYM